MWRSAILMVLVAAWISAQKTSPAPAPAPSPAPARLKFGEGCTVDHQCKEAFYCAADHKCSCRVSSVLSADKSTCLEAVVYGQPCEETVQCTVSLEHSACDSICQCAEGFRYEDKSGEHSCSKVPAIAQKKYGDSCSSSEECVRPFNCSETQICECMEHYVATQNNTTCEKVPGPKKYDEECMVESDCVTPFTCSSRHCACATSLVVSSDQQDCLEAVVYGEPCEETVQCTVHVDHSLCGANNTCQCAEGFQYEDKSGDHSCSKVPATGGSSAAQFSLGVVVASGFFSVLLNSRM